MSTLIEKARELVAAEERVEAIRRYVDGLPGDEEYVKDWGSGTGDPGCWYVQQYIRQRVDAHACPRVREALKDAIEKLEAAKKALQEAADHG